MWAILQLFFHQQIQVPVSSISSREGNAAETSAEETLDTSDNAAQETADNCNELEHSSSTVRRVSVTEISPLPKAQCNTKKRRGKKAELLTSTPQKKIMVEKVKKSNNKTKQSLLKKGRSGEWQCPMCSEPYINLPTKTGSSVTVVKSGVMKNAPVMTNVVDLFVICVPKLYVIIKF